MKHGNGWRWDIGAHPRPTNATIVVSEPTAEQKEERERKIKDGARVVPFGFARALGGDPVTWDGDDS